MAGRDTSAGESVGAVLGRTDVHGNEHTHRQTDWHGQTDTHDTDEKERPKVSLLQKNLTDCFNIIEAWNSVG